MATAVSVGYERRSVEDLVEVLRARGVVALIDVRAVAFSHRPAYRKGALERALAAAGIAYVHLPLAGNPYRDQKGDVERCLAAYRGHLDRNPAVQDAVVETITALGSVVAVLCYERVHAQCHRSVLLELVSRAGQLQLQVDVVE